MVDDAEDEEIGIMACSVGNKSKKSRKQGQDSI